MCVRFDAVVTDFNHSLFGPVQIVLIETDDVAMIIYTDQYRAASGVGERGDLVGETVSARQLSLELDGGVFTEMDFLD